LKSKLLLRIRPYFLLMVFVCSFSFPSNSQIVSVSDVGLQSAFQDTVLGHHKKGRAGIAADFDLDGYIDYFLGNPGDESVILRNVSGGHGRRFFQLQQVLLVDSLAWGGVAFDYDNDGDYDLFVTCGANEGIGYDFLFRNDWILNGQPTGILSFTNVTGFAGVGGPLPPPAGMGPVQTRTEVPLSMDDCGTEHGAYRPFLRFDQTTPPVESTLPVRTASANAVVADYDQDGDDDIFVSGNITVHSDPRYPDLIGRNTLWRNNGNGTFTDVTYTSGLGGSLRPTRHSTFFDYDNDGDADIYENNYAEANILWKNNGDGTFTDATDEASAAGEDLHYPWKSFVSGAADLDNDGWDDLVVFLRGLDDASFGSPYPERAHAMFLNTMGVFTNIAASTVINDHFVVTDGVMGCTVADVSGDGLPDIYIGNGGPSQGVADQFFVSVPGSSTPTYTDNSSMIDFPASSPPGFPPRPYPYRTHGTSVVDVDNDGKPELAVVEGGIAHSEDAEPNRLFKIQTATPNSWLKVRPVGDGTVIAKDAVGARVRVDVTNAAGASWSVYRTLFAGSFFSAQSGFALYFGLGDATTVTGVFIRWPNGSRTIMRTEMGIDTSLVVMSTPADEAFVSGLNQAVGADLPVEFSLRQNYPNPFNPSTTISYSLPIATLVRLRIFDLLGREVATLVDETESAGYRSVVWDGTDDSGRKVTSGMYACRLEAGSFSAIQKMILTK